MPRSPKGRAVARGLDARLHLQHAFMPAGYASLKIAQVNQKCRLTVITVSTATIGSGHRCASLSRYDAMAREAAMRRRGNAKAVDTVITVNQHFD